MNKILKIIIFIYIESLNIGEASSQQEDKESEKTFEIMIEKYLSKGKMNNAYLTYNQYIEFLNLIKEEFPNTLDISSIGNTYEKREIPLISFKSNSSSKKSGIIFTGMHHSREPVSMMMNLYILLHLLTIPQNLLDKILKVSNIYFIPIINIDGYVLNCEIFEKENKIAHIRKNRHIYNKTECNDEEQGVDLNRNYGYYFAYDDNGSSDSLCEEDYRGPNAFSEPETKAIKDFIDGHNEIKIGINYHSFGNLVITPFNYLKSNVSEEFIKRNFPELYEVYMDFDKEANYPQGYIFGNGDKTIEYTTNGDATDWFIGEKGILSFSPELGSGKNESNLFYPSYNITFDILESNLQSSLYAIQRSIYYFKGKMIKGYYNRCIEEKKKKNINEKVKCTTSDILLNVEFEIKNVGFGNYNPEHYNEKDFIQLKIKKKLVNSISSGWYNISNIEEEEMKTFDSKDIKNNNLLIEINKPIKSTKSLIIKLFFIVNTQPFISLYNKQRENNKEKIILIDIKLNPNVSYSTKAISINNNSNILYFNWTFNSLSFAIEMQNITEDNYYLISIHNNFPLISLIIVFSLIAIIILVLVIYKITQLICPKENMQYELSKLGFLGTTNSDLPLFSSKNKTHSKEEVKYLELGIQPVPNEIIP